MLIKDSYVEYSSSRNVMWLLTVSLFIVNRFILSVLYFILLLHPIRPMIQWQNEKIINGQCCIQENYQIFLMDRRHFISININKIVTGYLLTSVSLISFCVISSVISQSLLKSSSWFAVKSIMNCTIVHASIACWTGSVFTTSDDILKTLTKQEARKTYFPFTCNLGDMNKCQNGIQNWLPCHNLTVCKLWKQQPFWNLEISFHHVTKCSRFQT